MTCKRKRESNNLYYIYIISILVLETKKNIGMCDIITNLFFNLYTQAETMKPVKIVTIVEHRMAELVITKSYLVTKASPLLFPTGRIKIKCETSQFDLYNSWSEIELVDNALPKSAQIIEPSLSPRSTGKVQLTTH